MASRRPRSSGEWLTAFKRTVETSLVALGLPAPRWEPYEFLQLITSAWVLGLAEVDEAISAEKGNMSPNNASGEQLRDLAALAGVAINDGTASSVALTVTAWSVGDVLLSEGALAGGGGTGGTAQWRTTDDVVIPAGGTATVTAVCTDVGPTTALPGTIVRRLSGAVGWTGVTNAASAVPGTDADDAGDVRAAIYDGDYSAGSRSGWALKSSLEKVTGVVKAIVVFNDSMSIITVGGRSIPATGFGAWVYPSTISDDAKLSCLKRVYAYRDGSSALSYPTATDSTGVAGTVIGADGLPNNFGFWWVRSANVKVAVVVNDFEEGVTDVADVEDAVEAAVVAYFAALPPGNTVRQNDILGAVAGVFGVGRATVTLAVQDNPGTDPGTDTYGAFSSADIVVDRVDAAILYTVAVT